MEIKQTTRSVTDYHFDMTADELRAALLDPIAWADNVRAELSFELDVAAEAKPRHARAKVSTPKGAGRKPPRGGKGAKLPKLQCQHCDRQIAAKFMPKHLATRHPEVTTTPASSPA